MVLNGADNEKYTAMILIYLQRAFSTLNHTVLLEKMKWIGFQIKQYDGFILTSLTELFLFRSIMSCRKQGP